MNENRNRHGEWAQRKARRREQVCSPKELMLRDFLRATTAQEKRAVIKTFNPHYFVFGETLDPRKEVNHEEL